MTDITTISESDYFMATNHFNHYEHDDEDDRSAFCADDTAVAPLAAASLLAAGAQPTTLLYESLISASIFDVTSTPRMVAIRWALQSHVSLYDTR